jgi:hypothetical protein
MTSTSRRTVRGGCVWRWRARHAHRAHDRHRRRHGQHRLVGCQRQGAGRARSDTPVFVLDLDKGRFTAFDVPGPTLQDITRINNRGQIVGGTRPGRG